MMLQFSLSLMNKLKKNESAIFISLLGFGCSALEGSTFYQTFNTMKNNKCPRAPSRKLKMGKAVSQKLEVTGAKGANVKGIVQMYTASVQEICLTLKDK